MSLAKRDGRRRRPLIVGDTMRVRWLPQPRGGVPACSAVRVALPDLGVILVPPPVDLPLDPRCHAFSVPLRAAGRCLHQLAGRDDGGRRAPAHRDPDEQRERENVSRALTYAMDSRTLPVPTDSRGWRIDAPVSLAQWQEQNGHPLRRGSRRRR